MKNVYSLFLCALILSSCNYLDFDETNGRFTREDMYAYFQKAKQMLTNVYSYMPQGFSPIGNAMRDCATDDAQFADPSASIQLFNNGNWSSLQTVDTQWGLYNGIRAANEFIESISVADFSRFEHNTSYEQWKSQLAFFPYEARVLRAYYFFELARRYGDIAMPLKMLGTDEANQIAKTPFQEVISFIVKECDECAPSLPFTYADQLAKETGRVTKGFALAVKSKALLYAASPLHNPENNKERWLASAKAAWELINLKKEDGTPVYQLDPNPVANNITSKEGILFRMNGDNYTFELNNFPVRFTKGKRTGMMTGNFPTQSLVDAFQTVSGYSVTLGKDKWNCDDPDFDPQDPYARRDKRFDRTILANGMSFKGSTIEIFENGLDNVTTTEGGTPTGYFIRKYIQETTSFDTDKEVKNKHHWIIYRLTEAYLTFAESMIELNDDPQYTHPDFGAEASALWAVNQVRRNVRMPDINATPAYQNVLTKDGFMEALKNEWRVEFAFEDHRFWDIRRWNIGAKTSTNIDGVKIKVDNGSLSYQRYTYQQRTWNNRMNLYPIPQEELYKNSNLNPQNAGW